MRILLVLIIAGLTLLSLGSPEKIREAGTSLSEIVQQFPGRASHPAHDAQASNAPDFADVGEQADIPASAVLGDHVITPDSDLATASDINPVPQQKSFARQDQHSMEEIHAANADAIAILDRISRNYQ